MEQRRSMTTSKHSKTRLLAQQQSREWSRNGRTNWISHKNVEFSDSWDEEDVVNLREEAAETPITIEQVILNPWKTNKVLFIRFMKKIAPKKLAAIPLKWNKNCFSQQVLPLPGVMGTWKVEHVYEWI